MADSENKSDFKDIPSDAWDVLKGVNLFSGINVTPEQSGEPNDLLTRDQVE